MVHFVQRIVKKVSARRTLESIGARSTENIYVEYTYWVIQILSLRAISQNEPGNPAPSKILKNIEQTASIVFDDDNDDTKLKTEHLATRNYLLLKQQITFNHVRQGSNRW